MSFVQIYAVLEIILTNRDVRVHSAQDAIHDTIYLQNN